MSKPRVTNDDIFEALKKHEPITCKHFAMQLGLKYDATSYHLARLHKAGRVSPAGGLWSTIGKQVPASVVPVAKIPEPEPSIELLIHVAQEALDEVARRLAEMKSTLYGK